MYKIYIVLAIGACTAYAEQQGVRNPFAFACAEETARCEKSEKKESSSQESPNNEQALVSLMSTETQWQVKNVLPSSVIMQHKEDGQIREITLTGTQVS